MQLRFQAWSKIERLYRDVIITEKIDGTNAAVVIVPLTEVLGAPGMHEYNPQYMENLFPDGRFIGGDMSTQVGAPGIVVDHEVEGKVVVYAQSRKRIIAPGALDNYAFAGFVRENAAKCVEALGIGHHFGEWYGSGIQAGYGLPKDEKRFALFNTTRHAGRLDLPRGIVTVPVLYEGVFAEQAIQDALHQLKSGTHAADAAVGFKAEGVVVFHTRSQTCYKVLLENDGITKWQAAHA